MIIREMQIEADGGRLSDFDASFKTDRIYRVEIAEMRVKLRAEKLAVPFEKRYSSESIEHERDAADFAVVAEIDEKLAGFATVRHEAWNNRAVLTGIFVAPGSQRRGVGRALMEAALAYAKNKAARCLFVETQNVNYPAINFYRRMGFEFCGFDRSLYDPAEVSPAETALYFCRQLPPEKA